VLTARSSLSTRRPPTRAGKVLSRLRTLTELEKLLSDLLRRHSRFTIAGMTVPLHLLTAGSGGAANTASGRDRGAGGKKGKGKGKVATKAAAAVDDDEDKVRRLVKPSNVAAGHDVTRRCPAQLTQWTKARNNDSGSPAHDADTGYSADAMVEDERGAC